MGRSTASGGGILRHPAQTVTPAVTDRQTQAAETSSKMMMLAWHAAVDAPQDRKEMGRCCRLAMTVASTRTLRLAGHLLIICAQNHLLEYATFCCWQHGYRTDAFSLLTSVQHRSSVGHASLRIMHDQMTPKNLTWPDHGPLLMHTLESCLLHSPLLLHFQQVQQCPEVGKQRQAAGGGG